MKLHWKALGCTTLMTAALAATAIGCGDDRTASKASLEHALNRDYSLSADCLFDKPLPFPYEVSLNDKLLEETRHRLDALADAGLLDREAKTRQNETVDRYVLTTAGIKAAGDGRFCYGRRQVTSIEKFTPPVDYQGMPLTKVEYHFVLKDGASWAKADPLRNAFPILAKSTVKQPVDEATVVLTHDGWVLTY